jgi:hypothetical protein
MDRFNAIQNYELIEGWCSRQKAIKMMEYIDESTKLCVELGVWGGRSLLPIAMKCHGDVYGIDAWNVSASLEGKNDVSNDEWWSKINYNKMYNYTHTLMNTYNCDNVKLLRMKSSEAVRLFDDTSIDFLHQDSNHSEETSCLEVELYHNKVKPGGIWVFDDTNWKTTIKAQNLLLEKGYTEIYDSGEWKIYKRNKIHLR